MDKYVPVVQTDLISLQKAAEEYIKKGYKPVGGLTIAFLPEFMMGDNKILNVTFYGQAFLLED